MQMTKTKDRFFISPIGYVQNDEKTFKIKLNEKFKPGLWRLNEFSHIMVIWWATEQDRDQQRRILTTELPYAPGTQSGVFACRSEFRPNPVAVTVCQCLGIDEEKGLISVSYMDAFDKTPVIDIKPYFPVSDRVMTASVAPWAKEWPDCYEEAYKMAEIFANIKR